MKLMNLVLLSAAILLGGISCNKDDSNIIPNIIQKKKIATLSYEMESITITKTNEAIESSMDIVAAIPMIIRDKVNIELFEDGGAKMILNHLKPSEDAESIKLGLPDNSAKVARTEFNRGEIKMFDDKGNLLNKVREFDHKPFSKLVDQIKDSKSKHSTPLLNEAILGINQSLWRGELEKMIASPDEYGVKINEFESSRAKSTDRLISIRKQDEETQQHEVIIYDQQKGLLVASNVYDVNESFLSSSYYHYSEDKQLTTLKTVTKGKLPSGKQCLLENIVSFKDLKIEIL